MGSDGFNKKIKEGNMLSIKKEVILICCVFLTFLGCATSAQDKKRAMEAYDQALQATDPHKNEILQQGSEKEKAALELYVSFYRNYTEDNIKQHMRDLYAPNIYYRDGFVDKQGIDALEAYLISAVPTMHVYSLDLQDVAVHDGNYYLLWMTTFSLKNKKEEIIYLTGMAHLRFDKDGRVIFEQGFWDTGVIYERMPIIGPFIRWLKKRA
jgi:hypothetical protein